MGEKIRGHIRSNVIGYVALFVALSGTAYATHPGGANTIDSTDIIDDQVKSPDIRDGNVARADIRTDAVVTEHIATGGVQSIDVLNNSLTGDDIQNPTRSVNLPLGSFVDLSNDTAIDWTSGVVDRAPDFRDLDGLGLVIEYDDDLGNEDNGFIGSTFTVPQDYASGGSLALRVSMDAFGGFGEELIGEELTCGASINGGPLVFGAPVVITTADNTAYTVGAPGPYAPGASVAVHCKARSHDDIVRIHSIEFRYTATQ